MCTTPRLICPLSRRWQMTWAASDCHSGRPYWQSDARLTMRTTAMLRAESKATLLLGLASGGNRRLRSRAVVPNVDFSRSQWRHLKCSLTHHCPWTSGRRRLRGSPAGPAFQCHRECSKRERRKAGHPSASGRYGPCPTKTPRSNMDMVQLHGGTSAMIAAAVGSQSTEAEHSKHDGEQQQ